MRPSAGRSRRRPGRSTGRAPGPASRRAGRSPPPGRSRRAGCRPTAVRGRAAARRTARPGPPRHRSRVPGRAGRRPGPRGRAGVPVGSPGRGRPRALRRRGRPEPPASRRGLAAGEFVRQRRQVGHQVGIRAQERIAGRLRTGRPRGRDLGGPSGRGVHGGVGRGRCHAAERGGRIADGRQAVEGGTGDRRPVRVGFAADRRAWLPRDRMSPAGPPRRAGCRIRQSARTGQHLGHRAAGPLERRRDRRGGRGAAGAGRGDSSPGQRPYPPWWRAASPSVLCRLAARGAGSPDNAAEPAGRAAAAATAFRSPPGMVIVSSGTPAGWAGETRLGGRTGPARAGWVARPGLGRRSRPGRRTGPLAVLRAPATGWPRPSGAIAGPATATGREPRPDRWDWEPAPAGPVRVIGVAEGALRHRGVTRPSIDRVVDRGDRLHPHRTGRIGCWRSLRSVRAEMGASGDCQAHHAGDELSFHDSIFSIPGDGRPPRNRGADRLGSAVGGPPGHLGNPELAPLARLGGATRSSTDRDHKKDRRPRG